MSSSAICDSSREKNEQHYLGLEPVEPIFGFGVAAVGLVEVGVLVVQLSKEVRVGTGWGVWWWVRGWAKSLVWGALGAWRSESRGLLIRPPAEKHSSSPFASFVSTILLLLSLCQQCKYTEVRHLLGVMSDIFQFKFHSC